MGTFEILYVLDTGFIGAEKISAVNTFMAYETFHEISKSYEGTVKNTVCHRLSDEKGNKFESWVSKYTFDAQTFELKKL